MLLEPGSTLASYIPATAMDHRIAREQSATRFGGFKQQINRRMKMGSMRLLMAAALVASVPSVSFAFGPMPDVGQQVRGVSSAPLVEVGCKRRHSKRCGAMNRVDVFQRNNANVDIRSRRGDRNDVFIDQRNRADVDIDSG